MTINDHADAILRAAFPGATVNLLRECWDNERDAILAAVRAVYEDGRETALRVQIAAKLEQQP